jgi:hypothetical protein
MWNDLFRRNYRRKNISLLFSEGNVLLYKIVLMPLTTRFSARSLLKGNLSSLASHVQSR